MPPQLGPRPFRLGRRPSLDGLRGIAVLLVISYHCRLLLTRWLGLSGGFMGVDVFFVLSGFLITSLLIEERDRRDGVSFGRFYLRRAKRLLPALYLFLATVVVYQLAVRRPLGTIPRAVAAIAAFVANWFPNLMPYTLTQTWSLGVEEQFYLVWPALLLVLLARAPRRAMAAIVVLVVASAVARLALFHAGVSPAFVYRETETRFDGLMIGAAAAFALQRGWRPPPWSRWLTLPALGLLGWVAATSQPLASWLYDGGYTLVALATVVVSLEAILADGLLARVLSWRPLRACGALSYALYLWNPFVFIAVDNGLPHSSAAVRTTVSLGVLLAVTVVSRYAVEVPALRGTFRPRRRDPHAVAA